MSPNYITHWEREEKTMCGIPKMKQDIAPRVAFWRHSTAEKVLTLLAYLSSFCPFLLFQALPLPQFNLYILGANSFPDCKTGNSEKVFLFTAVPSEAWSQSNTFWTDFIYFVNFYSAYPRSGIWAYHNICYSGGSQISWALRWYMEFWERIMCTAKKWLPWRRSQAQLWHKANPSILLQ